MSGTSVVSRASASCIRPNCPIISQHRKRVRRQLAFIFSVPLSPALSSMYRLSIQQELLSGFGFGPNLRYLRIAKNNKKISNIGFRDQLIATVTHIENIYWDLVNVYEQSQVTFRFTPARRRVLAGYGKPPAVGRPAMARF